ncbi:Polyketide synthase [Pseudomonas synxantha]|uniref:Polyketide synthase n=1 Tax=Pseudomonas synxantha TaxID=47883 RepID=A0A3G7U5F3_9PSED|nr:alpha/beta fold hydrolase [Pseudomonas synxantha]AZE54557.1 Polyketide synthase [Pseudomonas synxantha]
MSSLKHAGPLPRDSDIAIVGIAGEFPGASHLDELWPLLCNASLVISPIAQQGRWPASQSTGYCQHAGFIDNAHCFDAGFFSIAPVQALHIDPQERRLLQSAYHALENSGYFLDAHGDVGVYAAAMYAHYQRLDEGTTPFSTSFAQIANRISHRLDLHGPSLCVDTMCSSSLVALHLAATALRNGECRTALVGAANVHTTSGKFRLLCDGGYLSRSGRCHSFGAQADGYVPGEGSVALVLKTFAQAQKDGDKLWGVIRGSAIGSDGGASAFTVPVAEAQARVMQKALERAAVGAEQISYVECHGTGTPVGDPIEIEGLAGVYGAARKAASPLSIGTVKGNIGHLEAAAGLAGLAKVLLQIRHRQLAPNLGAIPANPKLDLKAAGLRISSHLRDWPGPHLAGINSFGAGGTNAHVIVQAPPVPAPCTPAPTGEFFFPVSGHTPEALRQRIEHLLQWLDRHPDATPYSIAFTLACTREHHRYRICVAASQLDTLRTTLRLALDSAFEDSRKAAASLPGPPVPSGNSAMDYQRGISVDWNALYPQKYLVELPPYPFGRQHFDALNAESAKLTAPAEPPSPKASSLLQWTCIPGTGPSLLLLTPTNVSIRAWRAQIAFFQRQHFNLLIPIYPGHDDNQLPPAPFTLPDVADEIARYIDQHLTGPIHCAGWSLGAAVALHLADRHPHALHSLTLICGSARFSYSIPHMLRAFSKEVHHWRELIDLQLGNDLQGKCTLLAGASSQALALYYPLLRSHDLSDRLSSLSTRTLIIHGAADTCISEQECRQLGRLLHSRIAVLPGGHLLPITAAMSLNTLLLEHML